MVKKLSSKQALHNHYWIVQSELSLLMYNAYVDGGLSGFGRRVFLFRHHFFCSHGLHVSENLCTVAVAKVGARAQHDTFRKLNVATTPWMNQLAWRGLWRGSRRSCWRPLRINNHAYYAFNNHALRIFRSHVQYWGFGVLSKNVQASFVAIDLEWSAERERERSKWISWMAVSRTRPQNFFFFLSIDAVLKTHRFTKNELQWSERTSS